MPDRTEMGSRLTGQARRLRIDLRRELDRRRDGLNRARRQIDRGRPDAARRIARVLELRRSMGQQARSPAADWSRPGGKLRQTTREPESSRNPRPGVTRLPIEMMAGLSSKPQTRTPGIDVRLSDGSFEARVENGSPAAKNGNGTTRNSRFVHPAGAVTLVLSLVMRGSHSNLLPSGCRNVSALTDG